MAETRAMEADARGGSEAGSTRRLRGGFKKVGRRGASSLPGTGSAARNFSRSSREGAGARGDNPPCRLVFQTDLRGSARGVAIGESRAVLAGAKYKIALPGSDPGRAIIPARPDSPRSRSHDSLAKKFGGERSSGGAWRRPRPKGRQRRGPWWRAPARP